MKPLADAEARARIERDLDTSFLVEAAAGSGKTTLLIRRLLALVIDRGVPLRRIVATTFTERAAGEITLRLRAALEEQRQASDPSRRAAAERALLQLEEARIGTLHGIASELLREIPLEAGIDPEFEVLGQDEARALRERVVRAHLEEQLASPPEGLRRWLRRGSTQRDQNPIDQLASALERLSEQRDLTTPWKKPEGFTRDAALDAWMGQLAALLEHPAVASSPRPEKRDGLAGALAAYRRMHEEILEAERTSARDHDAIEARLSKLNYKERDALSKAGRASNWTDKSAFAPLKEARDALLAAQEAFLHDANAELASLLRSELWPALTKYEAAKRKLGALDFHDLLAVLRETLMRSVHVRRALAARIDHVVVDEVQDTDPLQLDVVALLAAADPEVSDPELAVPAPGKLFVVGDPKQSIYAFRRSSVDGYLRFAQRMVDHGAVRLELTSTFRCVPSIAAVVDRAARASFEPGPFQPSYAGLSPVRPEPQGRPSVIALPMPRPYGYRGDIYKAQVEGDLPELVASFVHFLVRESGWRIPDPLTGEQVPLAPSHIALLARNFSSWGTDRIGPFARALERRSIPHAHIGGKGFHQQEEIVALRMIATAIEFPDDELAVYAALRSPLMALLDADLFSYSGTMKGLHPLHVPEDLASLAPELQPVAEALRLLGELHRKRTRRSIEETLGAFLQATAAPLSLASAGDGDLLLARALRFMELAADREARGALSFRRFVESLDDAHDRGDEVTIAAPDGLDAVRFSTVHVAKGLEWPVVILIDPTTPPERPAKVIDAARGLYVEKLLGLEPVESATYADEAEARGKAEGARLLYVAATRARDLLVVPTTGDGPIGGWLTPLENALRPQLPRAAEPSPGCPTFGPRTVLMRGDAPEIDAPPSNEVAPGRHPLDESTSVTFWDPELLTRGAPRTEGVRGQQLFAEVQGIDGAAPYRTFEARRRALEATAHASSLEVVSLASVGEVAAADIEGGVESEWLALGRPETPSRRLQRLLDAVLEGPVLTDPVRRAARLTRRARELGADDEERAAAERIAEALLAHPDLGPLTPSLHWTPLTGILSSRKLLEGELLVTDHVEALGAALAIQIHASTEDTSSVKARLELAATLHQRAIDREVRAILVTLDVGEDAGE
jgi:ATP-dependent exoDNAse (exonuclease V) beta subunit